MLGFFTAITRVVSPEAMKKALPGLVPKRFLELNIRAFEKGYSYGLEIKAKEKLEPPTEEKPPHPEAKKNAPRKAKQ
jgi:Pyruvate/2-oxoacid:ferredoxin oxidoreductase gamma subunit